MTKTINNREDYLDSRDIQEYLNKLKSDIKESKADGESGKNIKTPAPQMFI